MRTTPAVGVGAGWSGGWAGGYIGRGLLPFRSRLLAPAVAAGLLAMIAVLGVGSSLAPPAAAAPPLSSLGMRAAYDVQAHVNWAKGSLTVTSTAHITNTTKKTANKLAFNFIPLRIGNADNITATIGGPGGKPATFVRKDQSLIVTLPKALAPDAETVVTIGYRAFFNSKAGGKNVLLIRLNGTAVAYRWIPWLSRVQPFDTPNFGETWVTGNSPRVTVTISSDVKLKFATTGKLTDITNNGRTKTFVATDVRDFNFSANPNYRIKKQVWNGITVRVYYRTDDPDALMNWTLRAMERFTDRVGPYPYDELDVAETPAGVGMESPGMIWVDGTLAPSRFAYIVVHEVAHLFFYATVGNNQGAYPVVDEALADFLTRDLLKSFRASNCPQQRLDLGVYDYSARCYAEVIYNQGGLYLRDYRAEVGPDAFWTGIRNFYRDFKFRLATTRDLLDALDAASGYDSQRHAQRFPRFYD